MLQPLIFQARYSARLAARRVVWGSIGGIFILVGLAFLAVALWIVLEDAYGALNAALILGACAIGIGFLMLAFSRLPPRVVPPPQAEPFGNPMQSPGLSLANLFGALVMGIAAGRTIKGGRRL